MRKILCPVASAARFFAPSGEPMVETVQRFAIGVASRGAGFDEDAPDPLIARAGASRAAHAGALIVAGTQAGPGGEVARAREAVHVRANLGDQILRHAHAHAGDAIQPFDVLGGRAQSARDLCVAPLDAGLQAIQGSRESRRS